jgi:hypothetical protein
MEKRGSGDFMRSDGRLHGAEPNARDKTPEHDRPEGRIEPEELQKKKGGSPCKRSALTFVNCSSISPN